MSQYGALGYAQHGWNAAQILGHYYTGTALGTTDPNQQVRVQLVADTTLGADHRRAPGGHAQARPDGDVHGQAPRADAGRPVAPAASGVATFTAPLQVAGDGGVTTLGGLGSYRGVLEFAPTAFSGLAVTNVVGLDDYLQGVVPGRVARLLARRGAAAQAIAARTYAITTAKSADFDHYADTRSQVYKGVGIEQPRPTRPSPTRAGRSSPTRASRSSPTSSRPRAARPSRSRTRPWAREPQAVAEVRRGRVRQRLAAPPLDDEADDGSRVEEARRAREGLASRASA